jgi:hypothetical protein
MPWKKGLRRMPVPICPFCDSEEAVYHLAVMLRERTRREGHFSTSGTLGRVAICKTCTAKVADGDPQLRTKIQGYLIDLAAVAGRKMAEKLAV